MTGAFAYLILPMDGGARLWLIWPLINCAMLAISYGAILPGLFGKRDDGSLAPFPALINLPWLLLTHLVWNIEIVLRREDPYNELKTGKIIIGRRLRGWEEIDREAVIDLTSEFHEPRKHCRGVPYFCFPILDGSVPRKKDMEKFREICTRVKEGQWKVFIHCAQGHGRTTMMTSVMLMEFGLCKTPDQAARLIREARPAAKTNAAQKKWLEKEYGV